MVVSQIGTACASHAADESRPETVSPNLLKMRQDKGPDYNLFLFSR